MTREEMIEQAKQIRTQVTRADVPAELYDRYPATVKEDTIPTREGDTKVFWSWCGEDKDSDTLIVNFHGGGFIKERSDSDEIFCRRMNSMLHCKVVDVDYRIAPDYPFPAAVHEAYDVTAWVRAHAQELGIDPDKIILMGHSAGGNLAFGVTMQLVEQGEWKPLALVIDYPPMDIYTDPGEKKTMGKGIPVERAKLYNLYYCDRELQKEPLVSPVFASDEQLTGFPPTLAITAGTDDLCNETEEMALRMARLGNEVTLKRFQGAKHGFTIYRTEGCDEAVAFIASYLKGRF